jgi:hypothetical protein
LKYRKRPVVIEARQLTPENMAELAKWSGGKIDEIGLRPEERAINIWTREGRMRASIGDFIIRGIKGEFYPCKPDIFEQTYELVSGQE